MNTEFPIFLKQFTKQHYKAIPATADKAQKRLLLQESQYIWDLGVQIACELESLCFPPVSKHPLRSL